MIFKYMKTHPKCGNPDTHNVTDVEHKVDLSTNLLFHFPLYCKYK